MEVYAVLPAYRPPTGFPELVRGLAGDFAGVVVIDDGSGPECRPLFDAVAALPGVTVLRHAVNLGKGAALKTGFNHVANLDGAAGVVTLDADGQHLADDVRAVRDRLLRRSDALVIGVRRFDGEVPLRSQVGNRLTRVLFRLLVGLTLSDTQSGLRGLPVSFATRLLTLPSQRYEFELDMLMAAKALGVPLDEVPIRTVYADGNTTSHFNPLLDSARIYFVLFRFVLTSISAALLDNALFALLYLTTGTISGSQIGARLVSATFNYLTVRRFAFHSDEPHRVAAPKYAVTAVVVAFLSYSSLVALNDLAAVPVLTAKLVVETLIFLGSFLVQRDLIFRRCRQPEQE